VPAQLVDLVEQREHQRHGVLLDRQIVAQVADQAEPRDVEVGEGGLGAPAALGRHPAELDPAGDLDPVGAPDREHHLGERLHERPTISARGS